MQIVDRPRLRGRNGLRERARHATADSINDQESAPSGRQVVPRRGEEGGAGVRPVPATQETRDKAAAGYPKAGWKFLNCDQVYNVAGESDWKPFASALKTCGVEAVVWVGSPDPNLENFLNAAKQVGFEPKAWATDPNQYTAAFAQWNGQNGGAGNNVYVRMTGVPFEFANQVPAVKEYMDLVPSRTARFVPRRAGRLGVPLVGHGSEVLRFGRHREVRARQRGATNELDRRRDAHSNRPRREPGAEVRDAAQASGCRLGQGRPAAPSCSAHA